MPNGSVREWDSAFSLFFIFLSTLCSKDFSTMNMNRIRTNCVFSTFACRLHRAKETGNNSIRKLCMYRFDCVNQIYKNLFAIGGTWEAFGASQWLGSLWLGEIWGESHLICRHWRRERWPTWRLKQSALCFVIRLRQTEIIFQDLLNCKIELDFPIFFLFFQIPFYTWICLHNSVHELKEYCEIDCRFKKWIQRKLQFFWSWDYEYVLNSSISVQSWRRNKQ